MNNGGMQLSSESSVAQDALSKAMHGMCLWNADFMDPDLPKFDAMPDMKRK